MIERVPPPDCAGCQWVTMPVSHLDLSHQAFDMLFGGVYIHETEPVYVLQHRHGGCPIHGSRGCR
jgi:hypothetical protein